MILTKKQIEVVRYGNTTLNISIGATGAGKTYVDVLQRIPNRIRNIVENQYKGIVVICGFSLETIEDNVLSPMRDLWGLKYIPHTPKNATEMVLFGKKVRLIGASIEKRTNILRGKNIVYAYCDEIVTYNEKFYFMLTSRMRCTDNQGKLVSKIDCACNPEHANHWFKTKVIDKPEVKKYVQHFTIYDNEYLPKEFVTNLEAQYKGTVYYDRYILGLWVNAEGLVYRIFADNKERWLLDNATDNKYHSIIIGVDFGQTMSKTVYIATGLLRTPKGDILHILEEHTVLNKGYGIDTAQIAQEHFDFYTMVTKKYSGYVRQSYCDHLETTINDMRKYHANNGSAHYIDSVNKSEIGLVEYIRLILMLFNMDRIKINRHCRQVIDSISTILYDDKKTDDSILDNGTTDVDTYDATRYSMSEYLINNKKYRLI